MIFSGKFIIIGYRWVNGEINLLARKPTPLAESVQLPLRGYIALRKTSSRKCIGWINFKTLEIEPCFAFTTTDSNQCKVCERTEGFLPCLMCNGRGCPPLNPDVEAYCQQQHLLYLASFGDAKIKVGTASLVRKHARLLEQGPLAAGYVAAAPGPVLKEMEREVFTLGYLGSRRRSEKIKLLQSRMTEECSRQSIETAFSDIKHRLSSAYHRYFIDIEWYDPPALSRATRALSGVVTAEPEINMGIAGNVVAANGSAVVLNDGVGLFALDLANLKSWIVEFDSSIKSDRRQRQMQLF